MESVRRQDAERRLKRISEMRSLINSSRRSMFEQWKQGHLPTKPAYDIRSDIDYWKQRLAEKRGE